MYGFSRDERSSRSRLLPRAHRLSACPFPQPALVVWDCGRAGEFFLIGFCHPRETSSTTKRGPSTTLSFAREMRPGREQPARPIMGTSFPVTFRPV